MTASTSGAALRRERLDGVLEAVRALGAATSLDAVLQLVADDVVELLGFRAAAVSARSSDDRLHVQAVAGPPGVQDLLHTSESLEQWETLLAMSVPSGALYFLDHSAADDPALRDVHSWTQDEATDLPQGVWHADDTILAPMRRPDGELVGMLSTDLPAGSLDDAEQRTALEIFVDQATRAVVEHEARERLDKRRRDAEHRWQLTWRSGLVGSAVIDGAGTIADVNEAGARALGWEPHELVGRHFLTTVPEPGRDLATARFAGLRDELERQVDERVLQHRDGRPIWTLMNAAGVAEGDPPAAVVIVQWLDITERKLHEARIEHELHHDPLTDLPNQRALEERLAELFAVGTPFGVLHLDVDGFKSIADGLGHAAGDELLVQLATRLRGAVPPGSLLSHLSGDEFVVCVPGTSDRAATVAVAQALVATLREPFELAGSQHTVRMSIGVSTFRGWHHHPVDVLREADQALLRAKRRGRSRIEVFDPGQDHPATRGDLDLEHALREAVDGRRELVPYFQSVMSLTTGRTVGYEALLRWRHPGHGVLLPERFLPVAERSGLSAALGWRMLDLVVESLPKGPTPEPRPWIAVNVSAAQLGRGQLVAELRRVVESGFGGDASRLHLEITETSLLDASPATVDELYAAADLGVSIALDDFGTGYSSLTLLRELPVAAIKIDRSFIAPIAVDVRARTIVQHTIELCRGLGMDTIAEGIETHEQLAWLQTLGCEHGQGYLIDRPGPWPFGGREGGGGRGLDPA